MNWIKFDNTKPETWPTGQCLINRTNGVWSCGSFRPNIRQFRSSCCFLYSDVENITHYMTIISPEEDQKKWDELKERINNLVRELFK